MSVRRALVIACLLVLPGVLLRVGPHAHLLATRSAAPGSATVTSDAEATRNESGRTPAQAPRRLSQRPRLLVAVGFAVEAGLHVALIVALLRSATLVSLLAALPRSGRAATTLFFAALMAGFLGGHDKMFPFVSWRMYSGQPADDPTVYLVDGETRTGSTVRVDLEGFVPAVGPRVLNHIIRVQAQATLAADSSVEGERRRSDQRVTLLALGRLYNARHPDDPFVRIRLAAAAVPLDATEPPWLRHQRELVSVEIDPQS